MGRLFRIRYVDRNEHYPELFIQTKGKAYYIPVIGLHSTHRERDEQTFSVITDILNKE